MNRDSNSVREYLEAQGVSFEMRHFGSSTRSAAESAAHLGIDLAQVVKTLCFVAYDKPVLILCPGLYRVSMKKLRSLMNCKKLPTARPEQIEAWTGFAVGGVNPFFPNASIPIYCDPTVFDVEVVWFGAGSSNALVSVPTVELKRFLPLRIVDIKE